jgi:N-methylhydantoinase A/oxoprolinase/acetone carboxylase beta subunit/N-methylhydantoinase B/oxoprolinase/acetone carboxylase alpha subunit
VTYRVGVDVGGTFTDFLLFEEESGASTAHKTPSTPRDPAVGLLRGLRDLLERAGVSPDEVTHLMHGTTVSTNAVLEGRGARVGLLTTQGFEQVLHLARGETPGPMAGWVTMIKPDPLAAVEDTRGVRERVSAQGEVVLELDEEQARSAIEELVGRGVESLAISLLNSYANPDHERRLRELLRELHPELSVSISSDVLPEFREYERTNVVVMNAYVRPRLAGYVQQLRERLRQLGLAGSISILRSDGGLMTVDSATEQPVHSLFSGPAGGVAGAVQVARAAGYPDFLSLDMGGTSTDVALCLGGEPILRREAQLGYFPLKVPAVDVRSVGAGGGSIAHVPEVTRALRVGPESAGAEPGPAAYGRGGQEPTVTDANLVLGYLPPELLGGAMKLNLEAARASVGKVAEALGLGLEAAAEGIVEVVNENMVGALRLVSVEKGYDPREFALLAFGGAGPLHANALAELMGTYPVIVPPTPGVLAALGGVVSPFRSEFTETFIRRFDRVSHAEVVARLRGLEERALEWLAGEGIEAARRRVRFTVDVRYHKQALEMPIEVDPEELERVGFGPLAERFAEQHERQYAFRLDVAAEFVNLRAVALSESDIPHPRLALSQDTGGAGPLRRQRIFHRGDWVEATVHERERLRPGDRIEGPAIVTQVDSTTVVLPGHWAEIDAFHNLVIRPLVATAKTRQADSPIVIDIIENALKSIRREMDAVIFRAAMSTVIREEHDSFPLLTDERGRMVAGQFGWQLEEFFEHYPKERMRPGDVLILNDPYLCGGAIQHTPDMLVLRPIFYRDQLVGFASQLGNLMDIGGSVPGSMPTNARSIFEEGIRFPPVKLYDGGELVQAIVDILARNSRTPELTVADTLAMAAATRVAEQRVIELCERFGVETYQATLQKLLDRTHRAAELMIERFVPQEPVEFEDYVDDDGRGNGPFKIRMSMWREGGKAVIDFAGSSPQAEGPINLFMGESMFKMNMGIVLIMTLDPQILFNHGYHDLIEVRYPKASIVQPEFPAPVSNRSHTLARVFDVLQGLLARQNPELATGAACGSSPHLLYSGTDREGDYFFYFEINYGGIPGRPVGDGLDVHAWWPNFTAIPVEYAESYFPVRVERIRGRMDSGGAGKHRGGNGLEKVYEFLEPGEVSVHDDRHHSRPWGIGGGQAAEGSRKVLLRRDGSRQELAAKFDGLKMEPGDRMLYLTAGAGGWGDPLERNPEAVRLDVLRGFLSVEKAHAAYGVVLDGEGVDGAATTELRRELRARRPARLPIFHFGPNAPDSQVAINGLSVEEGART